MCPSVAPVRRSGSIPRGRDDEQRLTTDIIELARPLATQARQALAGHKRMSKLRECNREHPVMGSLQTLSKDCPRNTAIGKSSQKPDCAT
jgi:hypothetical protein